MESLLNLESVAEPGGGASGCTIVGLAGSQQGYLEYFWKVDDLLGAGSDEVVTRDGGEVLQVF